MTIKNYQVPIMGKVLSTEPLQGDPDNPICILPILELLDTKEGVSYTVKSYDIEQELAEIELDTDETTHQKIQSLLPQLNTIKISKGWRLEKPTPLSGEAEIM